MDTGRLETIGYTQANARTRIDAFVARPLSYLVDIRYKPYCGWNPNWNRQALKAHYGRRYVHLQGLGNLNHAQKGAPIVLADPEQWIAHLASELERGCSYLLLCACKQDERCHRRLVYERILAVLDPRDEPVEVMAVHTEYVPTYATLSLWEHI